MNARHCQLWVHVRRLTPGPVQVLAVLQIFRNTFYLALVSPIMTSSGEIVGGSVMQGTGRPSKTYSQDRVCKEPDCGTQLSIYNRGKYCYAHEPLTVPRTRGRKIA